MHSGPEQIQNLRERIRSSDAIDDRDRELLIEFSDELAFKDTRYSDTRHRKLLQHLTMLAGDSTKYDAAELPDTTLAAALDDRDALIEVATWIKQTYDSEYSKKDYRVAIRVFADHVCDDGRPDHIEELSGGTPRDHKPMPDPAKMLFWDEHILPMIDHARNQRDEAAIALAWDLGPRPGEFEDLTVGAISDHDHGLRVSVDGKTGQRSPLIVPSVPYVSRWLDGHPAGNDADAPLWCGLNSAESVSYRTLLNMIQKPARRAGIDHTDITYRRMRKSSATYLASQNVNQAHLEDHHGWTRGSDVAAHYIAAMGEANDREIARAHGLDVTESEPNRTAPVACPRCGRDTPPDAGHCIHCGQTLDRSKNAVLEAALEHLENAAAMSDDPDEAMQVLDSKRTIEANPNAVDIDELHQLLPSDE